MGESAGPIAVVIDGLREGACVHGASANLPKDLRDIMMTRAI